jgi:hypothetical protein
MTNTRSLKHGVRGRVLAPVTALTVCCAISSACGSPGNETTTHLDALPRLVAEAGMRIGDFEDPDLGFSRVGGVDVDRDGNVYVLEAMVPEIRVYTANGTLLRRIGRRGEGPGEFERAPRFGVVGDTVWTVSYGNNRITLFDREGTLLSARRYESVLVALPDGQGHILPWTMRPDGRFTSYLGRRTWYGSGDSGAGVSPDDDIPWPFLLFDATGAVVDTIGWAGRTPPGLWHSGEGEWQPTILQIGGRQWWVPEPPRELPEWATLPDGYVLVEAQATVTEEDGTFTVTRFGLAGDTVYARTFHYRPIRYSSADLDSIAARAARGEAGGMVPFNPNRSSVPDNWREIARSLRDAMAFPDFKLPVEYAWPAQDGALWLRLRSASDTTARWLLLDAQGNPRGTMGLPAELRIMWNRGETFWAVEPDEYDVPWLIRFRIRPMG